MVILPLAGNKALAFNVYDLTAEILFTITFPNGIEFCPLVVVVIITGSGANVVKQTSFP